jgi:hypothetical protein
MKDEITAAVENISEETQAGMMENSSRRLHIIPNAKGSTY